MTSRKIRCAADPWFRAVFLMFMGVCLLATWTGNAQPSSSKEYQVKAAFLFHFMQFVEWPKSAFTNDTAPVRVCVLGEDPFGPALDSVLRGEVVQGRSLEVRRIQRVEDAKDCQLLYIGISDRRKLRGVVASLASGPVLTVGEDREFAKDGGMINFFMEDKKVRFEINPDAAERAGLKISSQLLRLGKIVHGDAGKGAP